MWDLIFINKVTLGSYTKSEVENVTEKSPMSLRTDHILLQMSQWGRVPLVHHCLPRLIPLRTPLLSIAHVKGGTHLNTNSCSAHSSARCPVWRYPGRGPYKPWVREKLTGSICITPHPPLARSLNLPSNNDPSVATKPVNRTSAGLTFHPETLATAGRLW